MVDLLWTFYLSHACFRPWRFQPQGSYHPALRKPCFGHLFGSRWLCFSALEYTYFYGHEKAMEFLPATLLNNHSAWIIFLYFYYFPLFSRASSIRAQSSVLGYFAGVDHSRYLYFCRCCADQYLSLDYLYLWRFSDFHRVQRWPWAKEHEVHPEKNIAVKILRFFIPVTSNYAGR